MDDFSNFAPTLTSPAEHAQAITPSDTADTFVSRGVMAATAGVIRVTLAGMADGTSVNLTVAATLIYPLRIKRIWATGTTATGVVTLW